MSAATQSIREIVSRQPSAAGIFHRFDIDLCLQADLSLEGACRELQLSVDQVLEKLAAADLADRDCTAVNFASLTLARLIQHIVRIHHQRVRQDLPGLVEMATKVAQKRRDRDPELVLVASLTEKLRSEMYAHIQKEEQVLFPFISRMEEDLVIAYPPSHAWFRSITHPVFMMEQDHESAGHIMAELIDLTHHFEPPSWACATHLALFSSFRAFESDLNEHVHLENDILFSRAIQLEAELSARS